MKQFALFREKGMKRATLLIFLAVLHCNNTALYDEALTTYHRVVRPGLNEWYPLNGDLASRIGGTAGSATGAYTAGTNRIGEAGKSVCVSSVRADFGSTTFGAIPFTISMWVKLNAPPAGIVTVWQKGVVSTFWNGLRLNQNNAVSFDMTYGNGGGGNTLSSGSIAAGIWYYLAFSYANGAGTFYVAPHGGTLATFGPVTAVYAQNAAALQINPGTLNLCADDLLHYNRALSADEVKENFLTLE